jgi:hypothetical protein
MVVDVCVLPHQTVISYIIYNVSLAVLVASGFGWIAWF